ncbi:MAG TPA: hypothetical protein IGR89_10715 [Oscillatoriaceae cyanobacterium M7585_C2015_266]|nr:hypothetical protein [Oscillatoriaceae cyanobacterium M7585_C2015_266]
MAVECLPALAPELLKRLQEGIILYGRTLGMLESAISSEVIAEVPLIRTKDTQGVVYISAIALKLAKLWNQPAMQIAAAVADRCTQSQNRVSFSIRVVFPGSIYLQISDWGLANWLQSLSEFSVVNRNRVASKNLVSLFPTPENAEQIFPVQYAHARCCSLLRLADREGLIVGGEMHAIPWLKETCLRLVHPAECRLISELVTATDALWQAQAAQSKNWFKVAVDLSQAFESFYSACRIFGEVQRETPNLALARLGLIQATQSVLAWMLKNLFGVCAPLEL